MMIAVINTNVLLVANNQHDDVSLECVVECVERLQEIQSTGVTVIDDGYRILGEYQRKARINPPKGVGDVFLKWLLRNAGNAKHVQTVTINEAAKNEFTEFPDQDLQPRFDAPDRMFAAVANAHPDKPPIWQAADCKWLDWWPALAAQGVRVAFLCPSDACSFYQSKFPGKPLPALPAG
jgi:hypothetical protein